MEEVLADESRWTRRLVYHLFIVVYGLHNLLSLASVQQQALGSKNMAISTDLTCMMKDIMGTAI